MNFKFDASRVSFTSDTHFNHTNIIKYCQRPFRDVHEMNETIIANWNNVASPDDIVFHLGDFCLGGADEWNLILDRLNGRIYLILGNHDLKNIRQVQFKSDVASIWIDGGFDNAVFSLCE